MSHRWLTAQPSHGLPREAGGRLDRLLETHVGFPNSGPPSSAWAISVSLTGTRLRDRASTQRVGNPFGPSKPLIFPTQFKGCVRSLLGERAAAECAPIVPLKHPWRQVDRAAHGRGPPAIPEGLDGRVKPQRAISPLDLTGGPLLDSSASGHLPSADGVAHDRRGDLTSSDARHGPRGECARARRVVELCGGRDVEADAQSDPRTVLSRG